MTKDTGLCIGSADFWAANIRSVENRPHRLFGSAENFAKLSPVSSEFAQVH